VTYLAPAENRLIDNVNVDGMEDMPTPDEVKLRSPLTDRAAATVMGGRRALRDILDRRDPRLFVVVGRARFTMRGRRRNTRPG